MLKHKEEPISKGDLWEKANRFYYKSGFLLGLVFGLLVALIIAIALY
jgi:tetrahydromethanopterin S-methyltransferase subunit B